MKPTLNFQDMETDIIAERYFICLILWPKLFTNTVAKSKAQYFFVITNPYIKCDSACNNSPGHDYVWLNNGILTSLPL